jgi:hypothetical protein
MTFQDVEVDESLLNVRPLGIATWFDRPPPWSNA